MDPKELKEPDDQSFGSDQKYPEIFGNERSYLQLDIYHLFITGGIASVLFLMYLTPIPQFLLFLVGEFSVGTNIERFFKVLATTFSLWGIQQAFLYEHS